MTAISNLIILGLIIILTVSFILDMYDIPEKARAMKQKQAINKRKQTKSKIMEEANMANKVIHPEHYNKNGMETIDVIKASMNPEEFKGFLTGNVIKYLGRYPYKNGVEDLEKAKWYLEKLIDETDTDARLAETRGDR